MLPYTLKDGASVNCLFEQGYGTSASSRKTAWHLSESEPKDASIDQK